MVSCLQQAGPASTLGSIFKELLCVYPSLETLSPFGAWLHENSSSALFSFIFAVETVGPNFTVMLEWMTTRVFQS